MWHKTAHKINDAKRKGRSERGTRTTVRWPPSGAAACRGERAAGAAVGLVCCRGSTASDARATVADMVLRRGRSLGVWRCRKLAAAGVKI